MITAAALQSVDVLAQIDVHITPKAPPGSNGYVEILRIFLWGVCLSGILAIMAGGAYLTWEKFNGGVNTSPKVIVSAGFGCVIAVTAPQLLNMLLAAV